MKKALDEMTFQNIKIPDLLGLSDPSGLFPSDGNQDADLVLSDDDVQAMMDNPDVQQALRNLLIVLTDLT